MGIKPSKSAEEFMSPRKEKTKKQRRSIQNVLLLHKKNIKSKVFNTTAQEHLKLRLSTPTPCTTEYISKLVLQQDSHIKNKQHVKPTHPTPLDISAPILDDPPHSRNSSHSNHSIDSSSLIKYPSSTYQSVHDKRRSPRKAVVSRSISSINHGHHNSFTKSSLNSSGWTSLSNDRFSHIDLASAFTEITDQSSISRQSVYPADSSSKLVFPPSYHTSNAHSPHLPPISLLQQLLKRPRETHLIMKDAFLSAQQQNDSEDWANFFADVHQFALQKDDELAKVYVARCLISGLGVPPNIEQGFHILKSQRSCETYFTLGHCYLEGLPATPPHTIQAIDKAAAFECFRKAANDFKPTNESIMHTMAEAQCTMARMLFQGEGIRQNSVEALRLLMRSAKNKNMYAQFLMGVHYQLGLDVSQDLEKAKDYYRKSAEQGFPDAQAALGSKLIVDRDIEEGIEWLERAVQQGNTRAHVQLGLLYDRGEGVPQNNDIALTHYKAAVENNNSAAQCILGLVFYFGRLGRQKNHKEAIRLIRQSAVSGFAYAQRVLGQLYQQGSLSISDNPAADSRSRQKKNEREAVRWYKRAALGNDVHALDLLGKCYENGIGVDMDYEQALSSYRRCAEIDSPYIRFVQIDLASLLHKMKRHAEAFKVYQEVYTLGHPEKDRLSVETAQLAIAKYHLTHVEGIEYNPAVAMTMLTSLAESRHDAHYWLGCCYNEGIPDVCEIDRLKAFHHFLCAAESGDNDATFMVANMMSNNIIPNKGPADAFPWYHKIATQGHPTAMHCVGLCYYKGIAQEKPELQMALDWFEKAARAGYSDSVAYIAGIYLQLSMANNSMEASQEHFYNAVSWLKQAAENDDTYSQRELGKIYLSGKLEAADHNLAFELFQKAALKNDAEAIAYLGDCYNKGSGAQRNLNTAIDKYLQAASLGYPYGFAAAAEVFYEVGNMDKAYDYYLLASKEEKIAHTKIGKTTRMMVSRLALGYVPPMETNPDLFKTLMDSCKTISDEEAFAILYELSNQAQFSPAFHSLALCYINGRGSEKDIKQAIHWFEKSVEIAKDSTSLVRLAEIHGYGLGVPVDFELALSFLNKSASMGDTEAQYKMGIVYLQGELGMQANDRTAANWFKLSAAKLHPESIFALSKITGMINDKELEIEYLKNSASLGHIESMYILGERFLKKLDAPFMNALLQQECLDQALKYLHMAADRHNTASLILLGKAYINCTKTKIRFSSTTGINSGDNLPTPCDSHGYSDDLDEEVEAKWRAEEDEKMLAIECFEKASALGDLDATIYAAEAWHEQKQYAAALELFEKAARQGSIIARFFCARYSIEGFGGCELNPTKGFQELYICANDFNCVHAFNTLGQCYENGVGTIKNDLLAYQWYYRAGEVTRDAEAYYRIGQMFAQDRIPLPSPNSHKDIEACKFYNLAINASDDSHGLSCYHLGLHYLNGILKPTNDYLMSPDVCLAIEYFRTAAELDVREAMLELGMLFLDDDFPLEDQEEGYQHLERAAEMESREAQFALGLLYHQGREVAVVNEQSGEEEEFILVSQDFEKAYDLFCRSAVQKHPTATYYLGIYHQHGIFVAPDMAIALEQYEKSVNLFKMYPTAPDRWQAELNLGRIFHQDEQSQTTAYKLFQDAHLHSPSQYQFLSEIMIACYHLHGWGGVIVQTKEAAATLLKFAEEQKHGCHLYLEVAQCYETGLGLPQDFRKAFYWYGEVLNKAQFPAEDGFFYDDDIEADEAAAMFGLAEFYSKGIAVGQDKTKADRLYLLSARKGSQAARDYLSRTHTTPFDM